MRIAVICGGPSAERGISLNSARSAMDHLTPLGWEIAPIYCDLHKKFYRLSPAQLYSNTPSDFDFKLAQTAKPLSEQDFIAECRAADIVLPVIHGAFGEDGELQELLEKHQVPFVGSPAQACRLMFDKAVANQHQARHGFATLPNCRVGANDSAAARKQKIAEFFTGSHIQKAVVKPSAGGSSLGIAVARTLDEAIAFAQQIFERGYSEEALIEPYCEGQEFTVLVLQNDTDEPVALIPSEIALTGGDIFSFRHKYLPTCHVEYHCPPRFPDATIANIQKAAEVLFAFFGMRDFARLDGWVMKDGRVIFSDFNPISGMEQNSFLFVQGSRAGLTHGEILHYIVSHAARRHGIKQGAAAKGAEPQRQQKVRVLFGGGTAERQVSLMSGTNVWLKLRSAPVFAPEPYILTPHNHVWHLPYSYTLNHTVDEILMHCAEADKITARLKLLMPPLRARLDLPPLPADFDWMPKRMTLEQFCLGAKEENAFVFNALHGGAGEDGTLQAELDRYCLAYNGSGPTASKLCMDKNATGAAIRDLNDAQLISAAKITFTLTDAPKAEKIWQDAAQKLQTEDLLIKPQADGCSAGVARIQSAKELAAYLKALAAHEEVLPPGTLSAQPQAIELPAHVDALILEPFIATDDIHIDGHTLAYKKKTGWIELTVGVLEQNGRYHALSPSITVAQNAVLSLEEKFQGGTGVNLTPPPANIVKPEQITLIRSKIEQAAAALGIEGYARLDIFFNTGGNQVMLIEANSLPGLTASTVIFHQALAEQPPLAPREFLAKLVELGLARRNRGAKTDNPRRAGGSP